MGLFRSDPKKAFANRVLDQLRRAGVRDLQVDQEQFSISYRRSDDGPGTLFLDNTFRECDGEEAEYVDHRISNLIQAVVFSPQRPEGWEAVKPMLRPVIRPVTFGLGAPAGAHPTLRRQWLPFLHEMVVIDTPRSMSYVTEPEIAKWGVTNEEVFLTARSNLATMSGATDTEPNVIHRFADDGDAYFVSRLLIDGWLASFIAEGVRPVAFIPDNNSLIVGPEHALGALLELVEGEYSEAARSISPQAYTVDDYGQVVPFPELPGHPDADRVNRAATILAASEYSSQKHYLDQKLQQDGLDIFVATYAVMQRPDESLFSCATWASDVDTLLPRASFVAMANGADHFFVSWAALTEYVDLTVAEDVTPQRYRVRSWPEPSIVEALRARQIRP